MNDLIWVIPFAIIFYKVMEVRKKSKNFIIEESEKL
jgi:hypothetical protein